MNKQIVWMLSGVFFWVAVVPVWAWSPSPAVSLPVDGTAPVKTHVQAVTDTDGGVLFAWLEQTEAGDTNLKYQQMNAIGQRGWSATSAGIVTDNFQLLSDGTGGLIAIWVEAGRIYGQRIDAEGVKLWVSEPGADEAGLALTVSATSTQSAPRAVTDGSQGLFLVWVDDRNSATSGLDIYAQHIAADGSRGWAQDDKPVSAAAGDQLHPRPALDRAAGIYVTWRQNEGVYAQRLDSNGNVPAGETLQWSADGVLVMANPGAQSGSTLMERPQIISHSDGQATLAWLHPTFDGSVSYVSYEVYAKRIDRSGNAVWSLDPGDGADPVDWLQVSQHLLEGTETFHLVGDGDVGANVVWEAVDERGLVTVYGQKIRRDGNVVVAEGPKTLAYSKTFGGDVFALTSDRAGGLLMVWSVPANSEISEASLNALVSSNQLYGQRFDSQLNPVWTANMNPRFLGLLISGDTGGQWLHHATVTDGQGGAYFTWVAGSGVINDSPLRAQKVYADGVMANIKQPVNQSPEMDGVVNTLSPTLVGSAFEDKEDVQSHALSQFVIARAAEYFVDDPSDVPEAGATYWIKDLPFTFPYFGKSIHALNIGQHGYVELLSEGDMAMYQDTGTEPLYPNILPAVDGANTLFVANDIYADDINYQIRIQTDHVIVSWRGATAADFQAAQPDGAAPLNSFELVIYEDGRIQWHLDKMDFVANDGLMYSGLYDNNSGGLQSIGTAIRAKSSYEFNTETQAIESTNPMIDRHDWLVWRSGNISNDGETDRDLSRTQVPEDAGLEDGQTYYWSVRYRAAGGDWSNWSLPTAFAIDTQLEEKSEPEPACEGEDCDSGENTTSTARDPQGGGAALYWLTLLAVMMTVLKRLRTPIHSRR